MARKYKKGRKSNKGSHLDISYNAYLRNRKNWESKGYTLTEALTKKEFKKEKEKAKDAGKEANFARELARDERIYSLSFERKYIKKVKKISGEDIGKGSIIGSKISRKQMFEDYIKNYFNGDYNTGRESFEALY